MRRHLDDSPQLFNIGQEEDRGILPEGLVYEPELIDSQHEQTLIENLRRLPFREFEFHGYKGKRRTVSFGWQYEFAGAGKLHPADAIPEFLLPLRSQVADFAKVPAESLEHVLAIEYRPGAGIGWHRDKPVFGNVIGVSLNTPCMIRFRREVDAKSEPEGGRIEIARKHKWERFNLSVAPRSAYYLQGAARDEWEHSILRVETLRYSITFRQMRESSKRPTTAGARRIGVARH